VGFEPNAMAQTVGKTLAVPGSFNDVAGGLIDLVVAYAGGHRIDGGLLRGLDDPVDFLHFW